jgi:hypothetical protein
MLEKLHNILYPADGPEIEKTRRSRPKPNKFATRVSGSSETKTYGKGVAPREYEEQPTLPRRSIFGKDIDERARIFNTLHVLVSPPEGLFSGKLLGTAIAGRWRASLQEPASLVKMSVCKCLK